MGPVRERMSRDLGPDIEKQLAAFTESRLLERIWSRDGGAFSTDEAARRVVENRLGWLTVADTMGGAAEDLEAFAAEMGEQGFKQVVLLGMGGSSLCPEVLTRTFHSVDGALKLRVLDSTDPDAVRAMEGTVNLPHTLFVVASKSGTTAETRAFHAYFAGRGVKPAQCVAITDKGTPLEAMAQAQGFASVFVNPSDIGGRYSALSYFGLVPAVLLGLDVRVLLSAATEMMKQCGAGVKVHENPAAQLGASLGVAALAGRDKLTLELSDSIASFGGWVEQLVAESTGKDGRGILPVHGEARRQPEAYGDDRVFLILRDTTETDDLAERADALAAAGHPVIEIDVAGPYALGGQFFFWEMVTAIAGVVLGVNPFDEPNVKESKELTAQLLETFDREGALPEVGLLVDEGGVRVYADDALRVPVEPTPAQVLEQHFDRVKPGDFIGVLAYVNPTDAAVEVLEGIRNRLGERHAVATTLGIGPRFLHSTGQLFKGGPDTGVFIQILHEPHDDLEIPEAGYGFGVLKKAQALGDFEALNRRGRRVVRLELGGKLEVGLESVVRLIADAAGTP